MVSLCLQVYPLETTAVFLVLLLSSITFFLFIFFFIILARKKKAQVHGECSTGMKVITQVENWFFFPPLFFQVSEPPQVFPGDSLLSISFISETFPWIKQTQPGF